jgi:hypothetical protein
MIGRRTSLAVLVSLVLGYLPAPAATVARQ